MAYTTINKPTDYFNTKLYTGDGTSSRAITGVGFQPDWVWVKGRSSTYYHGLWDVVRTNKSVLYTNATDAEDTTTAGTLTSFDSDGFTLPNVSGGFVNNSGTTYASWNWLASNTTASNTDGSITSSVSANTTSGFSIVSYTGNGSAGATIGHGLGAIPDMITVKNRSTSSTNWRSIFPNMVLGGASNGADYNLNFNTTNPWNDGTEFNDTMPTSSVFTLGTAGDVNTNGDNYIAYCWKNIKGYSKIGSYTGNGNADGTFVYTGFKPAFVMFKNSTTGSTNWHIVDNKRDTFNIVDKLLLPNTNGAEITQSALDLTSNGFKIRVTNGFVNTSGDNYIYMAFAEHPFVSSTGTPTTAR